MNDTAKPALPLDRRPDLLRAGFMLICEDEPTRPPCLTAGARYRVWHDGNGFFINCSGANQAQGETRHAINGKLTDPGKGAYLRHWPLPPLRLTLGEDRAGAVVMLDFYVYADGSPALVLIDEESGEPYAKLSHHVPNPQEPLRHGEMFLKGWNENILLPERLIEASFCRLMGFEPIEGDLRAHRVEMAPAIIAEFERQKGPWKPRAPTALEEATFSEATGKTLAEARGAPDTSDIPEATEADFARAKLRLPDGMTVEEARARYDPPRPRPLAYATASKLIGYEPGPDDSPRRQDWQEYAEIVEEAFVLLAVLLASAEADDEFPIVNGMADLGDMTEAEAAAHMAVEERLDPTGEDRARHQAADAAAQDEAYRHAGLPAPSEQTDDEPEAPWVTGWPRALED